MSTPRSFLALASVCALGFASPLFAAADDAVFGGGGGGGGGGALFEANPGATPIDPHALHLRAGVIPTPALRAGLEKFVTPAGDPQPVHYVIQLDGPMTPQWRRALRDARVRVLEYLPANAWIVRLDGADADRVAALDFIRWYGEYQTAWKIDPEVANRPFTTPERQRAAADGLSYLTIVLFDEQSPAPVERFIAGLKGADAFGAEWIDGNAHISVVVSTADVPLLAQHPAVQFVEEAPELTLRSNSNNRWVVQTNVAGQTPFYTAGIRGEGQIVGIIDSRIHADHCSFSDSAPIGPGHRKILAFNASAGSPASHGTHVAGTVVGDSGTDNDLRGVAYMGKLVHNIIPSPLGSNHPMVLSFLNQHHQQGARVHTNSWGNDGTTAYDTLCRVFDEFQWNNEDSMVTLAVTNSSTLKNPENAKNLLACGGTEPVPNQHQHYSGGTGPTTDQRRKPELYAPGRNTISSDYLTACGTRTSSGTSMATPAIAGAAMLARQYFTDGYYPTGVANPADAFTPSGALVKAVLLNSSVDMTGVPEFPSAREGWGRILLANALYLPGDSRRTVVEDLRNADGLSTNDFVETAVDVLSAAEPLNITLAWIEPPAAAGAAIATINDLDLVVTAPDGAVYRGNVFSGGWSAPGGARDARNNVEQVRISAPSAGVWNIRIEGAAVNQSTQGFALVVSGDVLGAPAGVSIAVASGVPGLVPPGEAQTVTVAINPGDDTIVEGSAFLAYRFSPDDPYTTVPLAPAPDDRYTAVIPAASCGDAPQFYVGVEGVESGPRTAPPSAPAAAYAYPVGEIETVVVLSETFDALPAGWTTTGLWHLQTACAVNPVCDGPTWMAYNRSTDCTYNTGAANSGEMLSAPIALPAVPPGGSITLSYCSTMQSENVGNFDRGRVFVNGVQVDQAAESNAWETRTIDLTAYSGQTVTLRFFFDTVDGIANSFRGWQVDNVRIVALAAGCNDTACPADWNNDTVVNSSDLSAFITSWLDSVQNSNLIADFNNDGAVNSTDLSAFITAWLHAVANGC